VIRSDFKKMSFISFKRQLSADLERMTSRSHGNMAYPKSATTFRKLGSTSHNRTKPVRRIKTSKINPKQSCVPVPPPPSRREHVRPFLNDRKLRDCMSEDGQISRDNMAESCSNCYPAIYSSNIVVESNLGYPTTRLLNSWARLFTRENPSPTKGRNAPGANVPNTRYRVVSPGMKNLPGFSYPRNSALLCNSSWRTIRARYGMADRRKEPTIALVVNLPKIEMAEPAVTLAYKHGKL
jgi:hypothetical protein